MRYTEQIQICISSTSKKYKLTLCPEAFKEKHSLRLQDFQHLMGLKPFAYWLGMFLKFMIVSLLQSLIAILCMLTIKDGKTGTYTFYREENGKLIGAIFLLFSALQTAHAILISCLFKNGKQSVSPLLSRQDYTVIQYNPYFAGKSRATTKPCEANRGFGCREKKNSSRCRLHVIRAMQVV